MDGLTPTAGVLAVVSIAIQLADSVDKLATFWNNIKEAPEYVRTIALDLELLSSVLTEIASESQHQPPDFSLTAILQGCQMKVEALTAILDGLERGFASQIAAARKWTALKAVFKSKS